MELPFPGMDPYLELPALWPDVHARLISTMCDAIQEQLGPNYVALITPYIALENIEIAPARQVFVPDVGIVRDDAADAGAVTTAITPAPLTIPAQSVPSMNYVPGSVQGCSSMARSELPARTARFRYHCRRRCLRWRLMSSVSCDWWSSKSS